MKQILRTNILLVLVLTSVLALLTACSSTSSTRYCDMVVETDEHSSQEITEPTVDAKQKKTKLNKKK